MRVWYLVLLLVAGCGGTKLSAIADAGSTSSDSGLADSGSSIDIDAAGLDADQGMDALGASVGVTFRYQPAWSGVTAVEVLGSFGQATDWTQPLASLTADGQGAYTAEVQLPVGRYDYLFRVKGDSAAKTPATLQRFALDPGNPSFEACPAASPTAMQNANNPCSVLDLRTGTSSAPTHHVRGRATYDGQGIVGYLAILERDEMGSHHFFVNRMDSATDGSFDFAVAAGHYRLQIDYPTLLKQTDAQRDPLMLQAARRVISSAFAVAQEVMLSDAEASYHTYDQLMPRTSTVTLPTRFTVVVNSGQAGTRAAVYNAQVGDPWFESRVFDAAASTSTTVVFDGRFNTMQAKTASVATGTPYFWGPWQVGPRAMGHVVWTQEGMVFPIKWR
jgi:hypothetical protein